MAVFLRGEYTSQKTEDVPSGLEEEDASGGRGRPRWRFSLEVNTPHRKQKMSLQDWKRKMPPAVGDAPDGGFP